MKGPVICGVDDSSALGAAEVARDLAERYELPLVYAHVLERSEPGEVADEIPYEASDSNHTEFVVEYGHPADRLVSLAERRQASFVVLGNHGPRSSLLGSISADVARRASCPVVVVPTTAEARPAPATAEPGVEGGIVRFALGHAVRRVA
jgi:nucleotide-binding universal stress UspA family protein